MKTLFVFLILTVLVSCASVVATRESIQKAHADNDTSYLEEVVSGRIAAADPALRADAERYIKEVKQKKIEDSINAAFESADINFLNRFLESDAGESAAEATPEMVKCASEYLTILKSPEESVHRCRASSMNPRVRMLPQEIQQRVFSEPSNILEPLVAELISGVRNPFDRVKLIHDWIADNIAYNAEGYFSGNVGDNSWVGVLKSRKSVCAGYADLFCQMCGYAGVTVKKISGVAKAYGYDLTGKVSSKPNHDWNAVRIGGRWYLVDVTWDSGHIDGSASYRKDYRTDYFFLQPEAFIYTHLPLDEPDQLLARPVSFEEYERMPWLLGEFFRYGLQLLTKGIGYTVETDRELKLEFSCPEDVVLDGRLADKNGAYIERTAFAVRDQSTTSIVFRAPKPGEYLARVGVWLRKETLDSFKGVLTFKTHYRGGTDGWQPFPLLYIDYFLNDSQLISPIDGVLIKGSVQMFRVKTSGAVKVAVYINNQMRELNKGADGVFSLSVRVPDTSEIILYAQKPGGTYRGIVHYLVR